MRKCFILALLFNLMSFNIFAQATGRYSFTTEAKNELEQKSVQLKRKPSDAEFTIKIGGTSYSHTGSSLSLLSTNTDATKDSSSEELAGGTFFIEYVFQSRFGVSLKIGDFNRVHEFDFGDSKVTGSESTNLFALNFRTYMNDHFENGFKAWLGVSVGSYTVNVKYASATEKNLDNKTTNLKVKVGSIMAGFDYVGESGGIRLGLGSIKGKVNDQTTTEGITITYDASGSTLDFGVYLFF